MNKQEIKEYMIQAGGSQIDKINNLCKLVKLDTLTKLNKTRSRSWDYVNDSKSFNSQPNEKMYNYVDNNIKTHLEMEMNRLRKEIKRY